MIKIKNKANGWLSTMKVCRQEWSNIRVCLPNLFTFNLCCCVIFNLLLYNIALNDTQRGGNYQRMTVKCPNVKHFHE